MLQADTNKNNNSVGGWVVNTSHVYAFSLKQKNLVQTAPISRLTLNIYRWANLDRDTGITLYMQWLTLTYWIVLSLQ